MIYWVTTRGHEYTLERHLETFGRELVPALRPMSFEAWERAARRLPPGIHLLTDIERLDAPRRAACGALADELLAAGRVVLNRPRRVKRRYELLRGLHAIGQNSFDVYRAADGETPRRFPVFLRCENDHKGARSKLLKTPAELAAAIAGQSRTRFCFRDELKKFRLYRNGPRRRRELLVVEFCETSDERKRYRKYSAFRVGGRIVPRHLFFGPKWMLKGPSEQEDETLAEEREYIFGNPHAAELRRIFDFAGIDYGRADYSVLEGKIQIWEINTNPMISTTGDGAQLARLPIQEFFARQFNDAVLSLHVEANRPAAAA